MATEAVVRRVEKSAVKASKAAYVKKHTPLSTWPNIGH
jgi:hypothetical protein